MLRHVIERADDSDLKALEKKVIEAKEKLGNNTPPFEENTSFNKLLARASKSYRCVIVIEALVAVVSDFHSRAEKVRLGRSKKITKYHEDMFQTIVERNCTKTVHLLGKLLKEAGAY